jgi:hypothetical protein
LCIGRTLYGLTAQIAIIRALDDVMSVKSIDRPVRADKVGVQVTPLAFNMRSEARR